MAAHVVTGNAFFVIQLSNGEFKKLMIEGLKQSIYTLKYADLDNTNEETVTLDKTGYANKNFVRTALIRMKKGLPPG